MLKIGSWSVISKKDPRWNCNGRDIVGGFDMPRRCREKLKELEALYGKPPDDLEYSYMKD